MLLYIKMTQTAALLKRENVSLKTQYGITLQSQCAAKYCSILPHSAELHLTSGGLEQT